MNSRIPGLQRPICVNKVAIIGAGFAGLAIAWNFLNGDSPDKNRVTLFDWRGIGQGASGKAVGLLHPFAGLRAKLNPFGDEGMAATAELLSVAAQALGTSVTAKERGILRLVLTEGQREDYPKTVAKYPNRLRWMTAEECQEVIPGVALVPGIWIDEGITVYAPTYLNGLWKACLDNGATFINKRIRSLQELNDFDLIVVAGGAEIKEISELSSLPVNVVKGQVLEFAWPSEIPPLRVPINSQVYIAMSESKQTCFVGATFEKDFKDNHPCIEKAKKELLDKAIALYPPLQHFSLINCHSGLRGVAAQHLPLIHQLSIHQWILTGLGSKGLLYHALYAKQLVSLVKGGVA